MKEQETERDRETERQRQTEEGRAGNGGRRREKFKTSSTMIVISPEPNKILEGHTCATHSWMASLEICAKRIGFVSRSGAGELGRPVVSTAISGSLPSPPPLVRRVA